jgi:hypothetical protein
MKKMLAMMLLMSLVTVSCNSSGDSDKSSETATNTSASTGSDNNTDTPSASGDVPDLAMSFSTNIEYLTGFTAADEDKYNQAAEIVKKVVATEAFRTKVLNYTYNGARQFADNNGLTNAQIYQSVLDAAERLTPAKNNVLDVGVKLYYENSSVVGFTSGSINYINVNTKFFAGFDPNEVAGNLFHEWLHKLGYGHDSAATAKRPYSVPYAIGYLIRDLGKNFL